VKITPKEGGLWISHSDGISNLGGMVVSSYYHPTKRHSATTIGKLGTQTSYAEAGEWAVSTQSKCMMVTWNLKSKNKTKYNVVE
jgi:hypothetical protein